MGQLRRKEIPALPKLLGDMGVTTGKKKKMVMEDAHHGWFHSFVTGLVSLGLKGCRRAVQLAGLDLAETLTRFRRQERPWSPDSPGPHLMS